MAVKAETPLKTIGMPAGSASERRKVPRLPKKTPMMVTMTRMMNPKMMRIQMI